MNQSQYISSGADQLLQNVPYGICLLGKDFTVQSANQLWLDMASLKESDIIGKRLSALFPQIRKNLPELLTEVAKTDKPFHIHEFPLTVKKDGQEHTHIYNFLFYPVYNANDELEYFTSIALEIPNIVGLEDRLAKSEERLRLATESNNISTWDYNLKTKTAHHSSSLPLIFGYDEDYICSDTTLMNHIIEEDLPKLLEARRSSVNLGHYNFEGRIRDKNGILKWISSRGKMFFDENNEPSRMLGVLQDISERKNLEKEIEDREVQYKFLADAMPQFIWLSDETGHLNYWNQAVFDYSGKTYRDFIEDDGWLEMVHPEDRVRNLHTWDDSVANKTVFSVEHRFKNRSGDFKWFLSRAVPDLDEDGNVKIWVGTSTDINEIKKQEHQKNDFIKIANHELKTPITTIKGYVQLLKKMRGNTDDQFLNNSLNTIENQVNKLNTLIGDLLDISRMENGNLPLIRKTFSLVKLVTETIVDIKTSENTHEINFALNCETDVEVNADPDRITQVINNLLTNAIKYSPGSKTVNVELSIENNEAVVSVKDTGIGMDTDELNKIFGRFYRVSGEDEETFPGFGIGLFIVKDILDRHHGKIWVESHKNKGSKFYFSLPLNLDKI